METLWIIILNIYLSFGIIYHALLLVGFFMEYGIKLGIYIHNLILSIANPKATKMEKMGESSIVRDMTTKLKYEMVLISSVGGVLIYFFTKYIFVNILNISSAKIAVEKSELFYKSFYHEYILKDWDLFAILLISGSSILPSFIILAAFFKLRQVENH